MKNGRIESFFHGFLNSLDGYVLKRIAIENHIRSSACAEPSAWCMEFGGTYEQIVRSEIQSLVAARKLVEKNIAKCGETLLNHINLVCEIEHQIDIWKATEISLNAK